MGLINDLLLEVMAKVVEMIEPTPIAPMIIDFESGKLVPNPQYKENNE